MFNQLKSKATLLFQSHLFWQILIIFFSTPLLILTILRSQGFVWPDEIFQSIEPAYHLVTGRGTLAWEFTDKARSTLYPYILSYWLRIIFFFSKNPVVLFYATRTLLALVYLTSVILIGRQFFGGVVQKNKDLFPTHFLIFSFIFLLFPLNYYFGFRTLTESISSSVAVIAVFLIQEELDKETYHFAIPSILLGLTYGLRFQMGIFLVFFVPLFCYQLWKKALIKKATHFVSGLLLGFLIYLASDYAYYGTPFISSFNYFKFNIIEGVAKKWGTSPFEFYFHSYLLYFNFLLIFLIPGIHSNFRRLYPIIIATFAFIIIHSSIEHKELRFIYFSFQILLYLIVSGVISTYSYIRSTHSKFSNAFLIIVILSSCIHYNRLRIKEILWNYNYENLQLFLEAERHGVHGNSLIAVSNKYAAGAGYVYMGQNFKDELYFQDLLNISEEETGTILKRNKIKNMLIFNVMREHFCKSQNFCKTLLEVGPYSWITQ